jgi:hypothetical protein
MGSRYKYFRNVQDENKKHIIKGFPDVDLYSVFKFQDDIRYSIPLSYRYRPDLIANKFYGDPKLFWVLVYANQFYNSPEDFDVATVIRIPRYERVIDMV